MSRPTEPAYWEDWARGMGWDAQQVSEAGRVGALAITRGEPPAKAMDIVMARVRDGRDVQIGPSLPARLIRSFIASGTLFALAAVVIGLYLHYGLGGLVYFPIATALTIVAAVALAIRNVSRRNWMFPAATAVLAVAAVALLATGFNS